MKPWYYQSVFVTCLIWTWSSVFSNIEFDEEAVFTNGFVVQGEGGIEVVQSLAHQHGFLIDEHEWKKQLPIKSSSFIKQLKMPSLNAYHLIHPHVESRSKRSAPNHLRNLQGDSRIKYAAQQKLLNREKRKRHIVYDKQRDFPYEEVADKSVYQRYIPEEDGRLNTKDTIGVVRMDMTFSDPYFKDEWYLGNKGQTGGLPGMDLNVQVAWSKGFTGKGVVSCILDDGIDHTHPDLKDNYDAKASADFNDKHDNDPMPRDDDPYNSHGTRCAGEIAAKANNKHCGIGVAYDSRIGGVRMLDGGVTDFIEAKALSFQLDYIGIFSASWGPRDDGRTLEGPLPLAVEALKHGVLKGRNGLGAIYVWATGNGGLTNDDCNADGYVSRPETLSIGSVNDRGARPYFMEVCPSTMAVVPTGGYESPSEMNMETKPKIKVVTTDLHKGCTLGFQGTSSAAPMAAGCIALLLQANGLLSWRDVQHIVVRSARVTINDGSWIRNGAGFHVSHSYGFGVLDCGRMVQLAQVWNNVPDRHACISQKQVVNQNLTSNGKITLTVDSTGCSEHSGKEAVTKLEHVQVHLKMRSSYRGDIQVNLTSPQGTHSSMLSPRPADNNTADIDFNFTTVHCWGEDPQGTWMLEIFDSPGYSGRVNEAYVDEWTLILYGYDATTKTSQRSEKMRRSYRPDKKEVDQIIEQERELSRTVVIKTTEELHQDREAAPDNTKLHHISKVFKDSGLMKEDLSKLGELLKTFHKSKGKDSHRTEDKRTFIGEVIEERISKKKQESNNEAKNTWLHKNRNLLLNIRKTVDSFLDKAEDRQISSENKKATTSKKQSDLKRLIKIPPRNLEKKEHTHRDNFQDALDKIDQLLKEMNS